MAMAETMLISLTNILPHDAVINILSRLPMKSLLQFRCVSKSWKNFFYSDPSFIKMHLDHSIKNYQHMMLKSWYLYSIYDYNEPLADEVEGVKFDFPFKSPWFKVWGSCNGLFLISPRDDIKCIEKDIKCIWNSSTGEYKVLPSMPLESPRSKIDCCGFEYSFTVYGFGYDKISEDYKVVRIDLFEDLDDEFGFGSVVRVYTLRSDSWRRVEVIWPYDHTNDNGGKLVNGALHWVAHRYLNDDSEDDDDDDEEGLKHIDIADKIPYTIISFNLEDEECREIRQPDYYINDVFEINVEVFNGCLCILCSLGQIEEEVWVMKDYGVKESWIRRFIINKKALIQAPDHHVKAKPIKSTKNGQILIEVDDTYIVVFDPVQGTTKPLKIPGMIHYFSTHTYVDSLISLNTGTFVWQQQQQQQLQLQQQQAEWIAAQESHKKKAEEDKGFEMEGKRMAFTEFF